MFGGVLQKVENGTWNRRFGFASRGFVSAFEASSCVYLIQVSSQRNFVDARITTLASTALVPLASSTPRKTKRSRTQVPDREVPREMNTQKTRSPARRVNYARNGVLSLRYPNFELIRDVGQIENLAWKSQPD